MLANSLREEKVPLQQLREDKFKDLWYLKYGIGSLYDHHQVVA